MFDYERYDHTYCRVLKDGEEVSNRKPNSASESQDTASDWEMRESSMQIEKENGERAEREPMIIVRTKRGRKTADIIVRANQDGKGVSTVVHSIVPKPKVSEDPAVDPKPMGNLLIKHKSALPVAHPIVHKIVNQQSPPTADVEPAPVRNHPDIDSEKSKEENVQIETTKSGRMRKLTAKAKQNSEDSKKKPKITSEKSAETADGETVVKKRRGRPPNKNKKETYETEKVSQDEKHASADSIDTQSSISESSTAKVNKTGKAKQSINSKVGGHNKTQSNPGTDHSGDNVEKTKTEDSLNSTTKTKTRQSQKPKKVVKNVPPKKDTPKRTAKSQNRSKLVVVTKAPPKRKSVDSQSASTTRTGTKRRAIATADHSIPAAKIDRSNIVKGSRRRT